jgi:hypothetical protein
MDCSNAYAVKSLRIALRCSAQIKMEVNVGDTPTRPAGAAPCTHYRDRYPPFITTFNELSSLPL